MNEELDRMQQAGTPTYGRLLRGAEQFLSQAQVPDACLDAWYLLSDTFRLSRAEYLYRKEERPDNVPELWEERLNRRSRREPLAYILGGTEFMGLHFLVEPGVLIPRQDTETLTEWVLGENSTAEVPLRVLDLCTGCGCIGLSLEKLGGMSVTLTDLSDRAVAVAERNRDALGCAAQIFQGDLFDALDQAWMKDNAANQESDGHESMNRSAVPAQAQYDIIVSNPPYIATDVIDGLQPEVRDYEPRMALDGHEDGLYFYRRITAELSKWLRPGGSVYMEIGFDQSEQVMKLFHEAGLTDIQMRRDLAGLPRVVRGVAPDV